MRGTKHTKCSILTIFDIGRDMINIKHLTFSQDMINIKKYVSQRVVIVVVVLMVVLKDFSRYVGLRDLQQDFERQKWACALLDIGPLGGR